MYLYSPGPVRPRSQDVGYDQLYNLLDSSSGSLTMGEIIDILTDSIESNIENYSAVNHQKLLSSLLDYVDESIQLGYVISFRIDK